MSCHHNSKPIYPAQKKGEYSDAYFMSSSSQVDCWFILTNGLTTACPLLYLSLLRPFLVYVTCISPPVRLACTYDQFVLPSVSVARQIVYAAFWYTETCLLPKAGQSHCAYGHFCIHVPCLLQQAGRTTCDHTELADASLPLVLSLRVNTVHRDLPVL